MTIDYGITLKLLSLKIKNFRSFGDEVTEIAFGDGVNLIVGENNVGKSTILKSFDLLKGEYNVTPNDFYKGESNKELLIEGNFKLSEAEAQRFFDPFVRPYQRKKKKVRRIFSVLGNKVLFAYSSKRGIYLRFGELHISRERGELISQLDIPISYTGTNWKDILNAYFLPNNRLSLFEVIRNRLTAHAERKGVISFGFDPCNMFQGLFEQKAKNFSEIRQSPKGTSDHVLESYDGRQVADVLFTLKNGNRVQRKKFREVKTKFNELFPNLKLEVTKESKNVPPRIVIEKTSIEYEVPIELVGAGIGEIIVFLTHLIASREMIFGLDMPELHFHPHAQRLLRNIVREQSEKNQFLVITHQHSSSLDK